MATQYIRLKVRTHPKGAKWARDNNQTVMQYPVDWEALDKIEAEYVDVNGGMGKGGSTYVVAIVDDQDTYYSSVVNAGGFEVTVMTEADIKAFSEANQDRDEEITDQAKMERLKVKASLFAGGDTKQKFTNEELKAIDPEDDTVKGIGKTKIFSDRIDQAKADGKISIAVGP